MKLREALKSWLIKELEVKETSTDDEFKEAASKALISGKLDGEKFAELTKDPHEDEVNEFTKRFDDIAGGITKLTDLMSAKADDETNDRPPKKAVCPKCGNPEIISGKCTKCSARADGKTTEPEGEKDKEPEGEKAEKPGSEKTVEPSKLAKMVGNLGGTPVEGIDVRVKEAADQYETTKSAATYPAQNKAGRPHPLAGQPIIDFDERGKAIQTSSRRDKAVAGSFAKFLCATKQRGGSRTFGFQSLPQHDKELLLYAMDNEDWNGSSDGGDYADICGRKLTMGEKQALIDDAVSGGLEAAPIVFDDQVIQTPLLHGELFPLVNTVPLDRGRRVEGVITGTVTGSWGGVDDSAIALFNTASYVSAFDTTIYRWEGAIRIGLDFLSDTPIDFGAHVTAQYGERLLEDLDDVVATGNGTTQPTGVMNAAGTTSIAFGAATTLGNYESMRFGVGKNEHRPNVASSAIFCGTETSYMRARAIPVGAADARRIGGMDYSSYGWMERPYKINESLTNAQIFYGIMKRYRMYRRRGLVMRTSTEGDTLIRRNEMLMVAMARYGGQPERGAPFAVTTTAPA